MLYTEKNTFIKASKNEIFRDKFKRLSSENYKTLLRKILKDLNKWRNVPYAWIEDSSVNMAILKRTKDIYMQNK